MSIIRRRRTSRLTVLALVAGAVSTGGATAAASPAELAATWGDAQVVDRLVGGIGEVDCASSEFCRAFDFHGNVFTMRHGQWSDATWIGAEAGALFSISCPAVTFCAAVDAAGKWLVNKGHGWSDSAPILDGAELYAIDCTSATFCVAVGHAWPSFFASTWDGVSWSEPAALPGSSSDVSCASPRLCVARLYDSSVATFDGETWSDALEFEDPGMRPLQDVSCSDGACLAIGPSSSATLKRGEWSDPVPVTSYRDLVGLSCTSGPVCYALREGGVVFRYEGGAWRRSGRVGRREFVDIDCTDPDHCLATKKRSQSFVLEGDAWRRDAHVIRLKHGVADVACASPGECTAVDDSGAAVRYDGARWQPPAQISGHHHLSGVSCPTSVACFAISWSGLAWRFDGTAWSDLPAARLPDRVAGLSCPTVTFCMALDEGGHARSFDGTAWTDRGKAQGTGDAVLSCAAPRFCMMTTWDGWAVRYDG